MYWPDKTILKQIMLSAILLYVYFIFAAASMDGFYGKFQLRDGETIRYNFVTLLDGSAYKPYVYRRLVPRIASAISIAIPDPIKVKLTEKLTKKSAMTPGQTTMRMYTGVADDPKYALQYFLIYIICLTSIFLGMLSIRAVCLSLGFKLPAATLTPLLFAILFPMIETISGYYYDCTEVLFLFTFLWLFRTDWGLFLLIPLSTVATLNKESFFLYLVCTAPLLFYLRFDRVRVVVFGLALVASLLTHFVDMMQYAENPGGNVEVWLPENLKFYLNPFHLLHGENVYRIPMPAGYNIFFLIAIVGTAWYGRSQYTPTMHMYFTFGGFVTGVFFLSFAHPGELRNLSLMYPALAIFISAAIERALTDFNYRIEPAPIKALNHD